MTSYQEIFTRALHRIEKDADFFSYYNVESQAEVEQLVMEQLASYLPDAIDKIYERGVPEVDFYSAMDNELQEFTIDLTQREIGLISSLMFLVYLERQLALLGAFKLRMSPSDLNTSQVPTKGIASKPSYRRYVMNVISHSPTISLWID